MYISSEKNEVGVTRGLKEEKSTEKKGSSLKVEYIISARRVARVHLICE
jgi:hypothetical protein